MRRPTDRRSRSLYEAVEHLEPRLFLAAQTGPFSTALKQIHFDELIAKYPFLTGAGTTVAVIDTGIQSAHLAFKDRNNVSRIEEGYDYAQNDAAPNDRNQHGTTVSSIIAANSFRFSDGMIYSGMAPGANILMHKVVDIDGRVLRDELNDRDDLAAVLAALESVQDAMTQDESIVALNLSLGHPVEDEDVEGVLDQLHDSGT